MLLAAVIANRGAQPVEVFCQSPVVTCETKANCQLPPIPPKDHVRVRVAVGITNLGDWAAGGGSDMNRWEMSDEVLSKGDALRWLVADIALAPMPEEVTATVEVE